ncbi:hypothetical protein R1sor_025409 [Riccia sorocarpa]|uniref:ABC transporter domain-containing protein n=1 Tax=Riccia sorocarpa TaxID=122646 RepID=A0ABD3GC71_9MARC
MGDDSRELRRMDEEHLDCDIVHGRLSWNNLSVYVNNESKILHDLSGYVEPGRVCAIMGPSGCGKSTLLDCLAGRTSKNITVTGDIRLNGRKQKISYGTAAYLPQEYDLLGTLTVSETIYYSAKLRLPSNTSAKDLKRIVKNAIEQVGLEHSVHTHIGNWHRRGLSGGEKRRVSIAIALLTRPRLLFLDEPTSGLDSASSQVYFGNQPGALKFFERAGFPCPTLQNPADHYLRCINSDFDTVKKSLKTVHSLPRHDVDLEEDIYLPMPNVSDVVKTLTGAYESNEKPAVLAHIEEMNKQEGAVLDARGSEASYFTQALTLTRRSFTNMNRDVGYYWLRLGIYIVLCLAVGTIFFNAGDSYTAITARAACMAFIVAFLTFMSVGGSPSFIEDIKVFTMERQNGHYGVSAFVIGNSLSSIPFLFLISLISTIIAYLLVDLHHGAEFFFYFVLTLFACLLVVERFMMAIASMVSNFLMGIIIGAGIQGIFILVTGFFRLPDDLPDPVWRYPMFYIAFHPYAFQGMLENDFTGQTFENINGPTFLRDYILGQLYQVTVSRSKWWNFAILLLMAVGYRMIFYLLIRFSESLLPSIRAWIAMKSHSRRRAAESSKITVRDQESP